MAGDVVNGYQSHGMPPKGPPLPVPDPLASLPWDLLPASAPRAFVQQFSLMSDFSYQLATSLWQARCVGKADAARQTGTGKIVAKQPTLCHVSIWRWKAKWRGQGNARHNDRAFRAYRYRRRQCRVTGQMQRAIQHGEGSSQPLGPNTGGQSLQSTTSMSISSIPAGLKPKPPRAIMIRLNWLDWQKGFRGNGSAP